MTVFVLIAAAILFIYLLVLEIEFHGYIGQSAGTREEQIAFPAKKYFRQERCSRWLHVLTFLLAAIVVFLTLMGWLLPLCALVVVLPLSVCVYRILFRCNFHTLSDLFVMMAVVLLYVGVLTLGGSTADLFQTGLSEERLAAMISSVSPLISGGVVLTIVLKLIEESGKSWLANSARTNANVASGTQKRFSQVRQIILSNRRHGFFVSLFLVVAMSVAEIIYSLISSQSDRVTSTGTASLAKIICSLISGQSDRMASSGAASVHLPLLADIGLLSILFCVIGFVLSAYMSEEALLKAERAYLGYTAAKLVRRFDKEKTHRDGGRCPCIKRLSYWWNDKGTQKTTYLWDDFRQVFFHFCYSAKDIVSNKEYESCATRIVADVLERRGTKWQLHIDQSTPDSELKEAPTKMERMCPTWDAAELFALHRMTYENFFVQINEHGILERSQKQHAEVSSMLCDMLKSISVAASTHKQPAESACTAPDISAPFQLFMFLHNIFLNSVKWETKTALFQHRNISPLDVYEIAFEMFINEYLHWRNDKVQCPFAWICRQNDCRLADLKGSLLALCRVVLFFPYNINETMKHFIRPEDVKVFERQEYEQYFIRLSEGNRLPVISNGFTKNNIRELNRNIHVLESNQALCLAIGRCSEILPFRDIPTDHASAAEDVITMYDLIDRQQEVIGLGSEAGFKDDSNVIAFWKLLYKLVVNINTSGADA